MKPGSPIHTSLEYEGADTLVLFMNFTNQEIDNYEVEYGIKLPKKDKKLLKNFLSFIKYHHKRNNQFNWWSLEPADLDAFLMDIVPNLGSSSGDDKTASTVSKFHSSVKLDVKQYPMFDGELGHWLKFKRNVLALAATHGLLDIFSETFVVPTVKGADLDLFSAKNQFVYSIWASRVFSSYPLGLIWQFEETKDGRGV